MVFRQVSTQRRSADDLTCAVLLGRPMKVKKRVMGDGFGGVGGGMMNTCTLAYFNNDSQFRWHIDVNDTYPIITTTRERKNLPHIQIGLPTNKLVSIRETWKIPPYQNLPLKSTWRIKIKKQVQTSKVFLYENFWNEWPFDWCRNIVRIRNITNRTTPLYLYKNIFETSKTKKFSNGKIYDLLGRQFFSKLEKIYFVWLQFMKGFCRIENKLYSYGLTEQKDYQQTYYPVYDRATIF